MTFSASETPTVIHEIIEQHAEEAAFLWTVRDRAVLSPSYSLKDLLTLDERVEAHLDGLRVAGPFGWQACEQALDQTEPGCVFAATVLAFDSGDAERIQRVLKIACLSPEFQRGLTSGLGWLSFSKIEADLNGMLDSELPEMRSIGIAAFAAHRRDPGQTLVQALSEPNASLRARALRACGELGKPDLLAAILPGVADQDDACRFFAAWSAARLGDRSDQVVHTLQNIAMGHSEYAKEALDIALRSINLHVATTWYQKLKSEPAQLRAAVTAAGIIGTPDLVTDLIDLMKHPAIARLAGQSFSTITGANLSYENLSGEKPEDFEAGPTEDPADDNVTMDSEENLSWPDAVLAAKWWNQHQSNFRAGRRYLRGKEFSTESFRELLIEGNQSERAAAALELGINETTRPLFEIRARAALQIKEVIAE